MKGVHDVYNEEWDSEGSGEEEEEEGEGGEEEGPLTNMGEGERARVSWEEVRYSCDICKKLFTSDMNLHLHI